MKDLHTIKEATNIIGLTRGALLAAIQFKRLDAVKIKNRWMISSQDLMTYRENRWKRTHPLKKGEITIEKAARKYNVPLNSIYSFIYTRQLKSKKKGKAPITFLESDLLEILSHKMTVKEMRQKEKKIKKLAQQKRSQERRRIIA